MKSTVHSILKENELQPHKLTYYLEKRDPEFEKKMYEVLMVYKEVNLIGSSPKSVEANPDVNAMVWRFRFSAILRLEAAPVKGFASPYGTLDGRGFQPKAGRLI